MSAKVSLQTNSPG